MDKVLISVIITCFNKERFISDAIEGALKQKGNFDLEILIIDDCSKDSSFKIIKNYHKNNCDVIKIFKNDTNLGITKTWIKICKEAKGKYIARLDGDDYWIDEWKLNKQLNLLQNNKKSKWCNSDFNFVDKDNNIIQHDCFKNKYVNFVDSYEKLLTTKGFTNPSTWLIDSKLLNQVNSKIDEYAVDDTYNISMELLQKTSLTFLNESTTVNRTGEISDSTLTEDRIERLYKTQLEYIEKYDSDWKLMLKDSLFYTKEIEKIMIHWKRMYELTNLKYSTLNKTYEHIINSKRYKYATKIADIINKLIFWR